MGGGNEVGWLVQGCRCLKSGGGGLVGMLEVVEEEGGGGGAAPAAAAAAAPCMSPIGLRHDASDDHQSIMIESLTHSALNDVSTSHHRLISQSVVVGSVKVTSSPLKPQPQKTSV